MCLNSKKVVVEQIDENSRSAIKNADRRRGLSKRIIGAMFPQKVVSVRRRLLPH